MAGNSSSPPIFMYDCSNSTIGNFILTAFVVIHVSTIFPLSIAIVYLGHQRWRQQRSFATTSHSDIFTYNTAAMEFIYMFGVFLRTCGKYTNLAKLITVGFYGTCNLFLGQVSFHTLTCVERYLAVVHPVMYLKLRHSKGVRIRNISIGCVWLLYCGWVGVTALYSPIFPDIPWFCFLVLALAVVSFCSLSVLCVLIRPGPSEMGGNREWGEQSKQKAFYTIKVITGVLWLYFLGLLLTSAVNKLLLLSFDDGCVVLTFGYLLTLPSSFVLPLLFLQRAGKLVFRHCGNMKR